MEGDILDKACLKNVAFAGNRLGQMTLRNDVPYPTTILSRDCKWNKQNSLVKSSWLLFVGVLRASHGQGKSSYSHLFRENLK